jgi:glucuronoarabinoxylan endo-1,4-beta-xylanase
MDGFGAADVWGAALSAAQADLFFSASNGIGLSLLRVGIDPTGADYAPYANAQMAAARGALVWGAPWTPPAAFKDNGDVNNGGHLLAADYDAWATTLAGFAARLHAATGVQLYGVSAQNEPDFKAWYASCLYTGDEMSAFAGVLGPKLHALDPPVKLIAAEPDLWADLWGGENDYGDAILGDATATSAVDILATHQYGNGAVTAPPSGVLHPIWETEASGVMGSAQAGPSADIANGLAVAGWIHDAIVTGGASAWHYWWLISLNADNEGLLLQGGGTTKRLYTMGNFSKFVRPGFVRIDVRGPVPSGVQITAYQSPTDGHVVVVAINTNAEETPLSVFVSASPSPAEATPWVTSATADLASQPPVAVSAGRLATRLPPESVTTLVGGA